MKLYYGAAPFLPGLGRSGERQTEMKQVPRNIGFFIGAGIPILFGLITGLEGFLAGILTGGMIVWLCLSGYFVEDLMSVPVIRWPNGKVVRLLRPGVNWTFWPLEKALTPISTALNNLEGVSPLIHTSDGAGYQVKWWVRYRLDPEKIHPSDIPLLVPEMMQNAEYILTQRIENVLIEMIGQKTANCLMSREGRHYLMRFFTSQLRMAAEQDGFWIYEGNIKGIRAPEDIQASFNQAAGIQVEIGAVEQASQKYVHLTGQYNQAQLDWIRKMELLRAMRKGGDNNHIIYDP